MSSKTAPRPSAPKSELEPRAMAALAKSPANAALTAADKLRLYRDMVRIRRFEERCIQVYQKGKIGGFLHLYIGQEAVATGTVSLLGAHDHIITAYRDHGHALAVGMTMNECMAELMGKVTGCSKGKGGSMHFFAPDKKYWGGHGIVGGQVPLGTGIAFALKFKGLKGCCLTFMGDGAVNQGAVHEAYNLAALWNLPVVFIIENNQYSMGTSQARSSAGEPLAKRADGYDMAWDMCNGNVLYEVRQKTAEAIKRAHEESKPTLLEVFTYRYRGHSVSDPDDGSRSTYRSKDEIREYRESKDPITLFQKCLIEEGVLDTAAAEKIDEEARAEAEASVKFAEDSPFPPPESILEDIYWEEDNRGEKSTSQGRIRFQGLE
ncbi:MAG TPA: pyruvate dehydrogenase (acetyl-transferring) E1 component subunit alpha [Opitutales bacterium]|nr:pyruvate dehydrogenase (acetyl-transferring) E1 component subunit alpha [Opitutales bacterium]